MMSVKSNKTIRKMKILKKNLRFVDLTESVCVKIANKLAFLPLFS